MTPPGQIFSARDVAARGTRDFTPLTPVPLFPPALEVGTSSLLFTGHDSTPQREKTKMSCKNKHSAFKVHCIIRSLSFNLRVLCLVSNKLVSVNISRIKSNAKVTLVMRDGIKDIKFVKHISLSKSGRLS